MKKRMLALVLCVVLLVSSVPAVFAAPADKADTKAYEEVIEKVSEDDVVTYTFKEVAKNDRFILAFDEASTYICLVDTKTNQKWYSNPPINVNEDPYVEGMAKTDIRSVLHISYTNTSLKTKEANSYAGSVMKKTFEVKMLDNGLRVDYKFDEAKITIPVQYTLLEDGTGMKAEVLYSEIKEQEGANTLNSLDFLMYFGASGEKDKGYFVVPDGSGATINFNNDKNVDSMKYNKPIYGIDNAETTETDIDSSRSEKINLPVFGMVKNGYGMLAEVVSGAETANIKAAISGNRLVGAYNVIYTGSKYRINYSLPLMGQISSETSIAMYNAQDVCSLESYAIDYHFTDNNKADYITLAEMYRDILLGRKWMNKDEIKDSFYAELYGAVNKKKSFLGFVYTAREELTSFEQAQAILQDLKDGGVDNINVQYVNFSDDFFSGKMEIKLNPSSSLGGKKGMSNLLGYAASNNVNVAAAADITTLKKGGNGFNTFFDVADAINISPIKVYPVSLNGNTFNTAKRPYYLLNPEKYGKATDTLLKNVEKNGYNALYFDEEAMQLYSDLAPEGYQSERTSGAQAEQYARLKDAGVALTFSNPNAYLFASASQMVNIPVCSSKEILFDMDIPFLQAVLRGSKNFAGESMNITDVSDESFLRHMEYGTNIRYALTNAESEALLNTDHTFLYSATYSKFEKQIKDRYAVVKEYSAAVADSVIVGHTREGDVASTTYSNGVEVVVNYKAQTVTIDGHEIKIEQTETDGKEE